MGPRVLAAWRRYWFTPASLTNLGVSRIILVAIALYLHPAIRYLRVASVAPGLWAPVPLLRVLGIPQPSLQTLQWMAHATLLLLLAVGVGVFTRIALALLFPLLLIQEAMANSMGKVAHGTIPLVYAFFLFLLAPCTRAFSLSAVWQRARTAAASETFRDARCRESAYARWPLDLLFIELAAFYFFAGLSKIRAAGLVWADGYTLQYHLLFKGAPLGRVLASHLWLCAVLSALVLIFELGFPLGMVRRLRPLALWGGALFHLGTTYFMNIFLGRGCALRAVRALDTPGHGAGAPDRSRPQTARGAVRRRLRSLPPHAVGHPRPGSREDRPLHRCLGWNNRGGASGAHGSGGGSRRHARRGARGCGDGGLRVSYLPPERLDHLYRGHSDGTEQHQQAGTQEEKTRAAANPDGGQHVREHQSHGDREDRSDRQPTDRPRGDRERLTRGRGETYGSELGLVTELREQDEHERRGDQLPIHPSLRQSTI